MRVRAFVAADTGPALAALRASGAFTAEEIRVAGELIGEGLAGEYELLAAEHDAGFAGYACIGAAALTAGAWYLYWICVVKPGSGAAGALMAGIEAMMRARGGTRLVAETSGRAGYARARAFYAKAGFEACGRIPDFYAAGDDCILFVRRVEG